MAGYLSIHSLGAALGAFVFSQSADDSPTRNMSAITVFGGFAVVFWAVFLAVGGDAVTSRRLVSDYFASLFSFSRKASHCDRTTGECTVHRVGVRVESVRADCVSHHVGRVRLPTLCRSQSLLSKRIDSLHCSTLSLSVYTVRF